MRNGSRMLVAVAAAYLAAPAAAQEGERYTFEKRGEGYVRMDRQSGAISICEENSGQLTCKLAADEREAFQDETGRLQAELDELEARVAALEATRSTVMEPGLPDEQTFDQALGLMERFFRSFLGIVKDLEQEFDEPAPEGETPQRT